MPAAIGLPGPVNGVTIIKMPDWGYSNGTYFIEGGSDDAEVNLTLEWVSTMKNKTDKTAIIHIAGLISPNFLETALSRVYDINPKANPVLIL